MKIRSAVLAGLAMVLASAFMIGLGRFLPFAGRMKMLVYEIAIVAASGLSLFALKAAARNKSAYFRIGDLSAGGQGMRFLLVKPGESWLKTGLGLLLAMTAGTAAFMVMGMIQSGRGFDPRIFVGALPWIVFLSAANAWSEEIFFRLIPAEILQAGDALKLFPLLSSALFGAAHWAGSPGGPFGMAMAAVLGWALSRSVIETKGMFWAFAIHLAQDLAIFGVLFGYGFL